MRFEKFLIKKDTPKIIFGMNTEQLVELTFICILWKYSIR